MSLTGHQVLFVAPIATHAPSQNWSVLEHGMKSKSPSNVPSGRVINLKRDLLTMILLTSSYRKRPTNMRRYTVRCILTFKEQLGVSQYSSTRRNSSAESGTHLDFCGCKIRGIPDLWKATMGSSVGDGLHADLKK